MGKLFLKVTAVLIVVLSLSSLGIAEEMGRSAKITDLNGDVQIKKSKDESWTAVAKGVMVDEGQIIKTGSSSSAVLTIDDSTKVEIEQNTQIMISELIGNAKKNTEKTLLDLAVGKVLIKAQKLSNQESKFEVKTPTSIVGVRGTVFSVEVEQLK